MSAGGGHPLPCSWSKLLSRSQLLADLHPPQMVPNGPNGIPGQSCSCWFRGELRLQQLCSEPPGFAEIFHVEWVLNSYQWVMGIDFTSKKQPTNQRKKNPPLILTFLVSHSRALEFQLTCCHIQEAAYWVKWFITPGWWQQEGREGEQSSAGFITQKIRPWEIGGTNAVCSDLVQAAPLWALTVPLCAVLFAAAALAVLGVLPVFAVPGGAGGLGGSAGSVLSILPSPTGIQQQQPGHLRSETMQLLQFNCVYL